MMIIDSSGSVFISAIGWVDAGKLWIYSSSSGHVKYHKIADADFLRIARGSSNYFSVCAQVAGNQLEFSVFDFEHPESRLASARHKDGIWTLEGDDLLWDMVPKLHVVYFEYEGKNDYFLINMDPKGEGISVCNFPWFASKNFDHLYQSIIGVYALPQSHKIIICVQRSNKLFLHDTNSNQLVETIELPGYFGNVEIILDEGRHIIWATNYDAIVKLDMSSLGVQESRRLQKSIISSENPRFGSKQRAFIGKVAMTPDRNSLLVPRPFSGDVILIDPRTLNITHRCELGRQPLVAGMDDNYNLLARDWKSGDLLQGKMNHI